MTHDFNHLETRAKELISGGRIREAMEIYYFMADGDASLDAGYLAYRLAECSEKLGEVHAAKRIPEGPHIAMRSNNVYPTMSAGVNAGTAGVTT